MPVSYFVLYQGQSSDPAGFLSHYRGQHAAILQRFTGIQSLVLHTPIDCRDTFPVNHAGLGLLAQMTFPSAVELNLALASPARADARADFARFPPFHGTVLHQALHAETIF